MLSLPPSHIESFVQECVERLTERQRMLLEWEMTPKRERMNSRALADKLAATRPQLVKIRAEAFMALRIEMARSGVRGLVDFEPY
jgi:hypothetical protein